jgi:CheY-like chemotaxis protein
MRVLLVEDSRTMRMENERALAHAGYEVLCAEDGEQAVAIARQQQPELILLDLLLPRMDGVQVLRELKKDRTTMDIPVVIVSSLSGKNHDKLVAEGAEEYLEKNLIMPDHKQNRLPALLQDIVCRINRKRGEGRLTVPLPK